MDDEFDYSLITVLSTLAFVAGAVIAIRGKRRFWTILGWAFLGSFAGSAIGLGITLVANDTNKLA